MEKKCGVMLIKIEDRAYLLYYGELEKAEKLYPLVKDIVTDDCDLFITELYEYEIEEIKENNFRAESVFI